MDQGGDRGRRNRVVRANANGKGVGAMSGIRFDASGQQTSVAVWTSERRSVPQTLAGKASCDIVLTVDGMRANSVTVSIQ